MFTPSDPAKTSQAADILAARAAGVPWEQLIQEYQTRPDDPLQHAQARGFVQFRSGLKADEDPKTVERAARILLAGPDAQLNERVWGLPADPADPEAADFSDLARSLDEGAVIIHTPPRYNGHANGNGNGRSKHGGKHERGTA